VSPRQALTPLIPTTYDDCKNRNKKTPRPHKEGRGVTQQQHIGESYAAAARASDSALRTAGAFAA